MTQKTHRISFHFFDIGGGDAIFIRFLGTDSQWHNMEDMVKSTKILLPH
jgi:hypothetical protein